MRGPKIILVTDPAYEDDAIVDTIEAAASALPPGALGVQLRDRIREKGELARFAERLRRVTREKDAWLVINGDAELARVVAADGVHLGGAAGTIASARATAGNQSWISVAAHSDAAVRAAVAEGADAALVSPIFPTAPASEMRMRVRGPASAPGGKSPRGTHALESARAIAPASFAIYALGGVTSHNAKSCIDAGADGVALIRGLLAAEDPALEAKALWRALGA